MKSIRLWAVLAALGTWLLYAASAHARQHWASWLGDLTWKFGVSLTFAFAWLNSNAAAVGACVAISGLALNGIFQYRADRRAERIARGR